MDPSQQSPRTSRKGKRFAGILVVVSLILIGVWAAHQSGSLAPLYHRLGWHDLANQTSHTSSKSPSEQTNDEHAAHQGMSSMPGMAGMDMPSMQGTETQGESHAAHEKPASLPGYSTVEISPERQQLIGVRLGKVVNDKLQMSIRAVGVIEPDQRRLARIQTRISGWITKLHVDFVGKKVKKGDSLLEIYSPQLLSSQNEYLLARFNQAAGGSPNNTLLQASRSRLELLGVAPEEIEELERTRKPRETLLLRSPIDGTVLNRNVLEGSYVEPQTELYQLADLSSVWLQAKIYEFELPHVEVGQPVKVTVQSLPNQTFPGKIAFVEPIVQEATRTVRVRVEIGNPDEALKPGMYADVSIEHDMGRGLLVPDSAVLRTGERSVCFRVLPGHRFEPVEVKLGGRFGDRFQIVDGLAEGDEILVSAGFLLDSESRLKATTAAGGHHHGG